MDDVQSLYKARFRGLDSYRNRVWRVLVRNFFQRYVGESDVVLDLGAGYGEFINNISCAKKIAMDINPDTRERVDRDVEVVLQDCSKEWPFPDQSIDVVFTSNFFEHLPNKEVLSQTIAEAKRCMRQGGTLLALGPNIKYAPGAYWDFWDHYIALTEQSLAEILEQHGFVVERRIGKFLPFTMVGGLQYPMLFVALYLRVPLAWRIFGKQFLVIAHKP